MHLQITQSLRQFVWMWLDCFSRKILVCLLNWFDTTRKSVPVRQPASSAGDTNKWPAHAHAFTPSKRTTTHRPPSSTRTSQSRRREIIGEINWEFSSQHKQWTLIISRNDVMRSTFNHRFWILIYWFIAFQCKYNSPIIIYLLLSSFACNQFNCQLYYPIGRWFMETHTEKMGFYCILSRNDSKKITKKESETVW